MSSNYFHRIDINVLYQPFINRLWHVLNECEQQGSIYIATSGLRTYKEQDEIYKIGRRGVSGEGIRTMARGGYSPHNFSVACDMTLHKGDTYTDKLNPDYTESHYKLLADTAIAMGLEAGFYWKAPKDGPHIQMPLKKHGFTWDKMRELYKKGGYELIFAELDKVQWW